MAAEVGAQTDPDFRFEGIPPVEETQEAPDVQTTEQPVDPLGNLAELPGKWVGHGFNAIWRPHHPSSQDRFLELNLTNETLVFTKINGPIPNRGLEMPDINLFGLTYMQQIADNNILPFGIGGTPPPNSAFNQVAQTFPELNLSQNTQFRFESPGVTQDMVKNPNSVIQKAIQGQNITRTVVLQISTKHAPIKGGGTANTAFLAAAKNPPGGNANAVDVEAIFWIERVAGTGGNPDTLQLQYTQLVELNFNGLTWPHVTVATLKKQ